RGAAAARGPAGPGHRRLRPLRRAVPGTRRSQLPVYRVRAEQDAEPAQRNVAAVSLAGDRSRYDRPRAADREGHVATSSRKLTMYVRSVLACGDANRSFAIRQTGRHGAVTILRTSAG